MEEENKKQYMIDPDHIVKLPNGKYAAMLVPDINKDQMLSIVDTEVLHQLVSYLPKVNIDLIKEDLIKRIHFSSDLEGICAEIRKELNFHESVNIMKEYLKDK